MKEVKNELSKTKCTLFIIRIILGENNIIIRNSRKMKSISFCYQKKLFKTILLTNEKYCGISLITCQRQFSCKPESIGDTEPTTTEKNNDEDSKKSEKIIKVAVIGVPNSGKSSFINHFVNRKVNKFIFNASVNFKRLKMLLCFFSGLSNITQSAYNTNIC